MRTIWPALLFGALAVLFPVWFGPALVRDLAARGEQVRATADVQIARAHCRSFFFVLTTCRVLVQQREGPQRVLDYAISGMVRPDKPSAVQSTAAPGYVTTTLGRDYLVNRAATFAGWMVALLALTWGGISYHAYHRAKARRAP